MLKELPTILYYYFEFKTTKSAISDFFSVQIFSEPNVLLLVNLYVYFCFLFFFLLFGILLMHNNILIILMLIEMLIISIALLLVISYTYNNFFLGFVFGYCLLIMAGSESAIALSFLLSFCFIEKNINVAFISRIKG